MQKSKNAFSMIELVFVIVILGILAAVAVPKFAATRTDAEISRARADIASIRSAIVSERQTRLIRGDSSYMPILSTGNAGDNLFTGTGTVPADADDHNRTLLMYGIAPGSWVRNSDTSYTLTIRDIDTDFTYSVADGTFRCTSGADDCDALVN